MLDHLQTPLVKRSDLCTEGGILRFQSQITELFPEAFQLFGLAGVLLNERPNSPLQPAMVNFQLL